MRWAAPVSTGRATAPITAIVTSVATNGVSCDGGPEILATNALSPTAPNAMSVRVGPPGPLSIWSDLSWAALASTASAISVTSHE